MAHATFGSPSGMYALEKCPGKLFLSKGLKQVPATEYSIEGTFFHDQIERLIPAALNGKPYLRMICKVPQYPDMHIHIKASLEKVTDYWKRFKLKHVDCSFYVEFRATLDKKMDIWGTSDVVFVGKNKNTKKIDILILDWKYGQGVIVKAFENLQGITYALGTIKTLGFPYSAIGNAMIIVGQMRLEDGWSDYTVKGSELQGWEDKIKAIVHKGTDIYNGKLDVVGNINAGEHCRFCPANYWNTCSARKKLAYDAIVLDAEEFELTPEMIQDKIKSLTLDEKVDLFLKKSVIEDILDANAKDLNRLISIGVKHPKLKIVQKRGHRSWKFDEATTIKKLKALGIKKPFKEPGVIGIVEAESILGAKKIEKLVKKSEGRKEIVRATDHRESILIDEPEELPDE